MVIRMTDLDSRLMDRLRDGQLPCAFAFQLAAEMGLAPGEIGAAADRLGVRISRCQLGLFGYKPFGRKGLLQRFEEVPGDVVVSLKASATDGAIPCAALWRIAEEHGLPRVAAACAAETLDLQVTPCQLGCF